MILVGFGLLFFCKYICSHVPLVLPPWFPFSDFLKAWFLFHSLGFAVIFCLYFSSVCPSPASAHWVPSGWACAGPRACGVQDLYLPYFLFPYFFSSQTRVCCVTKWPRLPWKRWWWVAVRWHCPALLKPHTQIQTSTGTEYVQIVPSSLSCTGIILGPTMLILLGVDFLCSTVWPTKPFTWWSPQWQLKTLPLTTVPWTPTVMQVPRKSAYKPPSTAWWSCLPGQLMSLDMASFFSIMLWSSLALEGPWCACWIRKYLVTSRGALGFWWSRHLLTSDWEGMALAARVPMVAKGECMSEGPQCPRCVWYRAGLDKDGADEGPI